jgi:pimeloyl-ACP methyl ester carboxylesterase
MWRWTTRVLVGLCSLIVVTALTGALYQTIATRKDLAVAPPPGQLVDIGGFRLHLWCTGNGAPAVILDTGLGGSSAGWGFVQPDVARFTRVCSYDRAGMGYSDPGPSPRTARRIANELAKLTIPLVVVTGARGADENWRQWQQDLTSLSERGCLMIARQSGHVVSVDQPEVVVEAIRAIVDTARGRNAVSLCPRIGAG